MPQAELDVLDPPVRTVQIAGEAIDIRPLTIGRIGAVMRALGPALDDMRAKRNAEDEEFDLVTFASRYSAETIAAIAAALGRDWEWVDNLPPLEFLELAGGLVEANMDFLPQLETGLQSLTERLQTAAGRISSASSSAPGTDTVM